MNCCMLVNENIIQKLIYVSNSDSFHTDLEVMESGLWILKVGAHS